MKLIVNVNQQTQDQKRDKKTKLAFQSQFEGHGRQLGEFPSLLSVESGSCKPRLSIFMRHPVYRTDFVAIQVPREFMGFPIVGSKVSSVLIHSSIDAPGITTETITGVRKC